MHTFNKRGDVIHGMNTNASCSILEHVAYDISDLEMPAYELEEITYELEDIVYVLDDLMP